MKRIYFEDIAPVVVVLLWCLLALSPLLAGASGLPCSDRTAWMDCTDAMSLPGSEHVPACDEGERVMVSLRTQADVELEVPLEVYDQRQPAECPPTPTEVRPAAERYPWCVVGRVQRAADEERPAVPPWDGVCCEVGCSCAGACEHITLAPPRGYATERMKRMGIQ